MNAHLTLLQEHLDSLVRFDPPERPLDEVVDDLRTLHLFAVRNHVEPALAEELARCVRLGSRALALCNVCAGMEEAVGQNFKAMVYGTLDHALIRTVLATSNWNLFTVLTTGTSFVLDRMAEYAYVRSSRAQRDAVVHNLHGELVGDLWEALARNPGTEGLSWEACLACRELVRRLQASLACSASAAPAVSLATWLLYAALLQTRHRAG